MGKQRTLRGRAKLTLALYTASLLSPFSIANVSALEASALAQTANPAVTSTTPSTTKSSSPSAAVATNSPEAKALAANILSAAGGLAKLRAVYDLPTRATVKIADYSALSGATNTVDAQILSKQDKIRIELNVMGQPTITGYNGVISWMQQGTQVFPSDPQTTKRIKEDLEHSTMLLLKFEEPSVVFEVAPDRMVEGQMTDVLIVTAGDGSRTSFFADKKTHMILRCEYAGTDFEQGLPATKAINYYDYREFDGTQLAYKSIEYTNDKRTSDSVTETIVADASIDDSAFEIPTAVKIAGLKNGPVEIPFEMASNEILIKSKVNDGNEYRFIVDTGATQNVMDQASANAVGAVSKGEFSLTTGSGFMKMGNANIKSIELGPIRLENVPMAVANLPAFSAIKGVRPAGILGANVLRRFLVTIDYAKKILILSDPDQVKVPPQAVVIQGKPTLVSAGLAVDAVIDDKVKVSLLVDTGAAFNNVSESIVKPIMTMPLLSVGSVQGVEGNKIQIGAIKFKTLTLGSMKLPDPIFSVVPVVSNEKLPPGLFSGSTMGILGNPFWSRFRVTIDYRNCRLFLEQSKERLAQDKVQNDIAEINHNYILNADLDDAITALQAMSDAGTGTKAGSDSIYDGTSITRINVALSQFLFEKALHTKSDVDVQLAMGQFNKASALGRASNSKDDLARLYSIYAIYLLNGDNGADDRLSVRRVLQTASAYSENQPELLIAVAMLMERLGNFAAAQKLLNDALFVMPSNWLALTQRYEFARNQKNDKDIITVARLMQHYWPGVEYIPSEKVIKSSEAVVAGKAGGKSNAPSKSIDKKKKD
ncbi:MAG: aspartyl protease family protein [Candidatus Obscuribacterales bacterium]|nr:aspartyl protease family protein [Candidatus Obscuribacterales bacterium]